MFRFLQQKQLIFPVPVENGHIGYIIDKLKQDEWTSTIKELKRPQWHKTIIWLVALFSKPTVFMMGAIASPIIADIYTNRISPYFAKPAIPDGPNQVISQLGTQDGQDGDRPHVK